MTGAPRISPGWAGGREWRLAELWPALGEPLGRAHHELGLLDTCGVHV